jgi:hypothetical protein
MKHCGSYLEVLKRYLKMFDWFFPKNVYKPKFVLVPVAASKRRKIT